MLERRGSPYRTSSLPPIFLAFEPPCRLPIRKALLSRDRGAKAMLNRLKVRGISIRWVGFARVDGGVLLSVVA